MSTGLTVYGNTPNAIDLINSMGEAIATSRLLGCENAAQGKVMAMTCIAKGCDPLSLAQRYDIIQGKLSMKSDAMLAEFRARGGRHKIIQRDSEGAEVELSMDGETKRFQLLWADACNEPFTKGKGGKVKDNYATPRMRMQMLWARVVSDGVRAMAPEVNTGIYTPEEVMDFDESVSSPSAVSDTASAPPAEGSAEQVQDASFTVKATGEQITRLTELFKLMGLPADVQLKAITSTGARDMGDLSSDGAKEVIDKLEAKWAQVQASRSETQTSGGACDAGQIEKLQSLIRQVAQGKGGSEIPGRLKSHMESQEIPRFADLSASDADRLIASLQSDTPMSFLELSFEGHSKNG